MTKSEENVLRIEIEKLEKKNAIMRKLSTIKGFYNEYFIKLRTAKSNTEAFNEVNKEYYSLFGHYRYNDFSEFRLLNA